MNSTFLQNEPVIRLFLQQLFYLVIGGLTALYFRYGLKKKFFGNFLLAFVCGVVGAVIGSFFLNSIFKYLIEHPLGINSLATIFGAFLFVWIYSLVFSERT